MSEKVEKMELTSSVMDLCIGSMGYSSGPHEYNGSPASIADVRQQNNGEYCQLQDDEIPAETEVLTSKYQVQEMQMKKHREKRILKLFISHILDDSKIQLSIEKENYFCMGQMIFKKVYVRGIITSVNLIKNGTHTFAVDDGTGTLDCFLFKNVPLEELRIKTLEAIEDHKQLLQQESNPIHRACLMMLQNAKAQFNEFIPYKDFALGDTVELIGKLNEYLTKRNCAVQSIQKVDSNFNSSYYEDLDYLYKTVYL